ISSFGRRPSSAHIAESKSLKNSGENTFCQSSARPGRRRLLGTPFILTTNMQWMGTAGVLH
ncbi:hypothetical protein, partial [Bradyrhizobium sp. 166]|uniref:hypothetical protein n=1 Tax=Bradyrhizobium sp. 166 TaxID=2782638 RepID=UPI001FF8914D